MVDKQTKKTKRQRYKDVNVWRTHFGSVSVLAVYDVYSQKFDVPYWIAKKMDFSKCVEALRKLENPDYVPHKERQNTK